MMLRVYSCCVYTYCYMSGMYIVLLGKTLRAPHQVINSDIKRFSGKLNSHYTFITKFYGLK